MAAKSNFEKYLDSVKEKCSTKQQIKDFKLSTDKLKRLLKRQLVTFYGSDSVIEGRSDLLPNFRIYTQKNPPVEFCGKSYDFLDLHKVRLNQFSCGKSMFGLDIEYFIGGKEFSKISNIMKEKFKFTTSGTDHSNDVLEHRPQPQNNIEDLIAEVKQYYDSLHTTVGEITDGLKGMSDGLVRYLFDNNTKPPKMSFDFYVGTHLHLHIKKTDFDRVKKMLDLLAVWYNSRNPNLWKKRLSNNYGRVFNDSSDLVRSVSWDCGFAAHKSFEYRAFNSGTPNDTADLLRATSVIVKNKSIKSNDEIYSFAKTEFEGKTADMKVIKIDAFLKDMNVI